MIPEGLDILGLLLEQRNSQGGGTEADKITTTKKSPTQTNKQTTDEKRIMTERERHRHTVAET